MQEQFVQCYCLAHVLKFDLHAAAYFNVDILTIVSSETKVKREQDYKTKEMIINTSHCNFLDKLSVSDVEIERVNVFKLLGVHINRSLKWDDHVSAICNKAATRIF